VCVSIGTEKKKERDIEFCWGQLLF